MIINRIANNRECAGMQSLERDMPDLAAHIGDTAGATAFRLLLKRSLEVKKGKVHAAELPAFLAHLSHDTHLIEQVGPPSAVFPFRNSHTSPALSFSQPQDSDSHSHVSRGRASGTFVARGDGDRPRYCSGFRGPVLVHP